MKFLIGSNYKLHRLCFHNVSTAPMWQKKGFEFSFQSQKWPDLRFNCCKSEAWNSSVQDQTIQHSSGAASHIFVEKKKHTKKPWWDAQAEIKLILHDEDEPPSTHRPVRWRVTCRTARRSSTCVPMWSRLATAWTPAPSSSSQKRCARATWWRWGAKSNHGRNAGSFLTASRGTSRTTWVRICRYFISEFELCCSSFKKEN